MRKSTKWLALVSITVLVVLTLLGGIVSALAGNDNVPPVVEQTVMAEGVAGAAPVQEVIPPAEEPVVEDGAEALAPATEILADPAGGGDLVEAPATDTPVIEPDAGTQCKGKICVIKFLDTNENGKIDGGEIGMAGVTITLNGGNAKQTGNDGKVCYDDLNPGEYTVSEIVPTGYHATTQTSYCIKICWEDCVTVYFGNAPNIVLKGSISGHKWLDPNGDGSYEDKTPLEGVTIELWKDNTFFDSTTTASDGSYSFTDLEPGNYTVKEISPAGMVPIPPDSIDVTLAEGQNETGKDFYNKYKVVLKGSISGHKYADYDWDGEHDPGEPGKGGVIIKLFKDGGMVAETTTASDGSYSFDQLADGSYTVEETVPPYWKNSSPISLDVTVADGSQVTGVDFHNYCDSGVVEVISYWDKDCNGKGGDDVQLAGVTVQLIHKKGGVWVPADGYDGSSQKTTAPGWSYPPIWMPIPTWYDAVTGWNNLPCNDGSGVAWYDVNVISIPDGWTLSEKWPTGPYALKCESIYCRWQRVEIYLTPKFHINGHKYEDVNCNGTIDPADTGVPGVEVKLFKLNESSKEYEYVKSTTTAGANGYYEFTELADGVYKVQEVLTPALLEDWFIVSPAEGVFEGLEVGCGDSFDNLDFLNARYGAISGHKYEDKNCNGVIDAGDTGVPGVEVKLFKWNEGSDTYEYVKSTTTAGANGYYEFTGLLPGTYKVQEILTAELLEDWYIVSPAGGVYEGVAVSCGSSIENKDFLNARYGAIEGWKYWDKDENGIMDGEDEGLAGVTIILTPEVGPSQTAVTDEDGYFFFDKLLPGKYTIGVDESTAPDYYPISATSIDVEVTCGKTTKVYFSEAPYGSISGKKWLDADFDGIWGEDEKVVIEGITIKLYAGNPPQELIDTAVTGKDGYYEFTGLKPGTYTVVEEGKEGYFSCTPDSVLVELSAGEGAVVDFGNCPYGRIEGLKFLDLDGDGAQDPGEPTLEGVEITLVGLGDVGAMAVAITGKDGTFIFKNLLPGEYSVEEKVPSGYYATRPIKVEVVVGPGESVSVIFANALYGSIIGNKWLDDGDSQLDPTKDKPKAGMTVKLTGKSIGGETVSMQTTTAQDGSYSFLLLEAGSYNVTEVYDPQKMKAISPDSVDVTLAPGGKAIVDFLNVETEVGGEVVTPPSGETLPTTGMDQLPLLIAAAILVVIGLAFLAFGLRRRYQE